MKKYFFGWSNIKHVLKQVYYTFSNKPSELSRKRIESCILFLSAMSCALIWFAYHFSIMTYLEIIAFTGTLFVYAGYTMNAMQKEKLSEKNKESE